MSFLETAKGWEWLIPVWASTSCVWRLGACLPQVHACLSAAAVDTRRVSPWALRAAFSFQEEKPLCQLHVILHHRCPSPYGEKGGLSPVNCGLLRLRNSAHLSVCPKKGLSHLQSQKLLRSGPPAPPCLGDLQTWEGAGPWWKGHPPVWFGPYSCPRLPNL